MDFIKDSQLRNHFLDQCVQLSLAVNEKRKIVMPCRSAKNEATDKLGLNVMLSPVD